MTNCSRRAVAVLWILTICVGAILASHVNAQNPSPVDILLGRRPKPKDYNQPPDRNEFQQPTNGQYTATPTFFDARSDNERCAAIDLWLSSIRYEASNSRYYARSRRAYSKDDEIDMARVSSGDIVRFASADFRNIFGKSLPEFSEKDAKKVGKALNKCSYQRWVGALEWTFNYNKLGDWAREFEQYEVTTRDARIARERDRYRERYETETRRSGYPLAELLKETDKYRLHAAFLNNGNSQWCSATPSQAVVGLVMKVNENVHIRNNQEYWKLVEDEIVPATSSRCSPVSTIYILNYVEGFYIDYDKYQIESRVNPNRPSDVMSIGIYSANTAQRGWLNGDAISKLTGSTRRSSSVLTFQSSQTNEIALTSIADLRSELRFRKERYEAVEKLRREREAAAAAVRKAESERQAEIERQQRIVRKRESHRAKAADVLKFLKRGAPAKYSFVGYSNQDALQNIYAGNFEPFTGGHDQEVLDNWGKGYLQAWLGGGSRSLDESLADMARRVEQARQIAGLRLPIMIAYFAYHQAYEEMCFPKNAEMPWSEASFRTDTVFTRGLFETDRIKGETFVFSVRTPFAQKFMDTYNAAQEGNFAQLFTGTSITLRRDFQNDFRKFLRAEGCGSPVVRQFEINLYLATSWLLSLQELQATAVK